MSEEPKCETCDFYRNHEWRNGFKQEAAMCCHHAWSPKSTQKTNPGDTCGEHTPKPTPPN